MKVLFIAQNIPTPKKHRNDVILEIGQRLQEEGIELDILYPKEFVFWGLHFIEKYAHLWKVEPWIMKGCRIYPLLYYRLPIPQWSFLLSKGDVNKLPSTIRKNNYDLLHAHFLFPDAILGVDLKDHFNAPLVITIREADIKNLKRAGKLSHTRRVALETLMNSDLILTLNQAAGDFISEEFGVKTHMIPHGINPDLYNNKLSMDNKNIDVLVVASAINRKNIDWVIKAFLDYPRSEQKSLVIVSDGPELSFLKELANGHPHISFRGRISHTEVIHLMQKSRIFALPSSGESFGRVYLESATQKNAIIALAKTGIDGVFRKDEGVSFVNNYEEFEDKLHSLLQSNEKVVKMAEQAYERSQQLSWDKIIVEYIENYRNLIST